MKIGSIFIDEFNCQKQNDTVILTHWHNDHFKGLSNSIKCSVFCTHETSLMLKTKFPSVKVVIIKKNKFVKDINCKILVLDANHMEGSVMLYFQDIQLLYTSDYRLNDIMIENIKSLNINGLKKLILDGTFHHPDVKFLTEQQSCSVFEQFILNETTINDEVAVGIYHVGTCDLFRSLGFKFKIHNTISDTIKKQLNIMYGDIISKHSRYLLVNPRLFNNIVECKEIKIVIPSALWFCCEDNMQYINTYSKDVNGIYRINYTRHSDYYDNNDLIELLNPNEVEIIHNLKVNLKCSHN